MKILRVTIWNDFITEMKCKKATYVPTLTLRVSAGFVDSGRGQSIARVSATCLHYSLYARKHTLHEIGDIQSGYELPLLLKVLLEFFVVRKNSTAKFSTQLIP